MTAKKIGFIGIGSMGLPMVRNLMQAGFDVTIYDVVTERMKELIKEGAKAARTLSEVISPGGIIITMLTNDEILLEVISGKNGIADLLGSNEIHISMSTVSPETTKKIYSIHQKRKTNFISGPVFGRPESAAKRQLWIFLSGKKKIKELVRPILDSLGQGIYDFGENITSANIVKLAANFLVLSAIETMGEAFTLIEKNNLDKTIFADMLTQTLFACPAYQYHAHKIALKKFSPAGFSLNLGMKDIKLIMENAQNAKASMPILKLLHKKLLFSVDKNRGNLDWAAITLD